MSVVMNNGGSEALTDDPQQQNWFESHPWIALGLGGLVALALIWMFTRNKQASSQVSAQNTAPNSSGSSVSNPGGATGDLSGLSTDSNGNPIVYVPTQDTFLNYNYASNSYNSTSTSTVTTNNDSDGTTAVGGPPPTPVPKPPVPPHQPPPPQQKGSWTCRYTVKEGDTLSAIAEDYGTSWPTLYGHNTTEVNLIAGAMHYIIPGGAWNNIRPGEVLIVPCK